MPTKSLELRVWTPLLLGYLLVRFFFTRWLDGLGAYSSLLLELALVSTALFLARDRLRAYFRVDRKLLPLAAAFLPAGYLTYKAAGWLQIPVPFDLRGGETLFFLLIMAPVLEELIFRFFLWEPLARLNRTGAFVTATFLFSYAHLHAIWFVPVEVHPFVWYQAFYTLFLAAACGYSVLKYRSLGGAILIHFAFNLGFYLGFLA